MQRAKKALGIQSSKSAMDGGWQWMLPSDPKMIKRSEGDQGDPMITFETDDHVRSAGPDETRGIAWRLPMSRASGTYDRIKRPPIPQGVEPAQLAPRHKCRGEL
ncbi:hypothetical protein [Microvirga pakistanensis]|uniref:hypothetical protein n=1 Tax=Microvirga pakistanensis TaxID=1682650 RepID=UPI00106968AB|nr:hypothetical protein [Microvirga pakistanensis]